MPPKITLATLDDLDILAPLFDAYRQFYRHLTDLEGARTFLRDRIESKQSVIFLAGQSGFTQLYPSFSSVSMKRIFILNDLYVIPEARRTGTGAALLKAAADYGREAGAVRLELTTEISNATAQSLYEAQGWKRDEVYYHYGLSL